MTNMTSGIESIPGMCGVFKSSGEGMPRAIDEGGLPCGYLKGHDGPHTWELCGVVGEIPAGGFLWWYRCDLREGHDGEHSEGGQVSWAS